MDALDDIVVRQSKFCSFDPANDLKLTSYIDHVHKIMNDNGVTVIGIRANHVDEQEFVLLRKLVEVFIEHEVVADFILEQVLPKKYGPLSDEEQNQIRTLLNDASLWDFSNRFAIKQTEPTSATGRHADSSSGLRAGNLRISLSDVLSTIGFEGWFNYISPQGTGNGGVPVKAPNGSDSVKKKPFDPGLFVMWEESSGQHAEPLITDKFLKEHASRFFLTFNVSFDRLMERVRGVESSIDTIDGAIVTSLDVPVRVLGLESKPG